MPYENQQYGPAFDNTIQPIGPVLEDGSQQMGPYNNSHYKDKIKFFNTGLTFQNSASIAGEDFYVSIEDAKIKGLVPDDGTIVQVFVLTVVKHMANFRLTMD